MFFTFSRSFLLVSGLLATAPWHSLTLSAPFLGGVANRPIVLENASAEERATPCDGLELQLTNERKTTWALAIAKQLNTKVDVLRQFGTGNWSVVDVSPHDADELFLFYRAEPTSQPYIARWSGAVRIDEEASIKKWVLTNAPNIPSQLASCFAWYVTNGRKSKIEMHAKVQFNATIGEGRADLLTQIVPLRHPLPPTPQ